MEFPNVIKRDTQGARSLRPHMTGVGAWAYGVGSAVGWGSLVVTTSQYLLQGGIAGSIAGIVLGTVIMALVARCYGFMMRRYPTAGGSYTYVRHVMGNDYGFLIAWFLVLAYLSVFWANATSLPLFSRFFLGGAFRVGYLYQIFDYDVYLGEVLLTVAAIGVVGFFCTRSQNVVRRTMIALVVILVVCIAVCLGASLFMHASFLTYQPAFLPDKNAIVQIGSVVFMTPWAFIGFESLSNANEEIKFSRDKIFRVLLAVVLTCGALYIAVTLLSVTAYPARYGSWLAYLSDLSNLEGIDALPPFYAARYYLGDAGLALLMAALLALVLSSLIGNLVALSRLSVALGRDGLIPERFTELNRHAVPFRGVAVVTLVSMLIPFLGRTPIGWIVDITTLAAVMVYGLVTLAELRIGRTEADTAKKAISLAGFAVMVCIGLVTLLPSLYSEGTLASETYLLITVWAVLGFVYFRQVLRHDDEGIYGNSPVVWVLLLALVFFTSTVWTQQSERANTVSVIEDIRGHMAEMATGVDLERENTFIDTQIGRLNTASVGRSLLDLAMLSIAVGMMFSNNSLLHERRERSERALTEMREVAYKDPLTGVGSKAAYLEWGFEADERISAGATEEFVVIVCDVNGLKFINDTQGHKAGDAYICEAAELVSRYFAQSSVFRIGGDEFVVVPHKSDLADYAEILAAFDAEVESNITQGRVVISAGYSIFRPGFDSCFHDVFERADARMYQRKLQLKGMGAATRD